MASALRHPVKEFQICSEPGVDLVGRYCTGKHQNSEACPTIKPEVPSASLNKIILTKKLLTKHKTKFLGLTGPHKLVRFQPGAQRGVSVMEWSAHLTYSVTSPEARPPSGQ
jgi:hypothetical protein